jgi:hypothetical protein
MINILTHPAFTTFVGGVFTGVIANKVTDYLSDVSVFSDQHERSEIKQSLHDHISALPQGQGALVQYFYFNEINGNELPHGPVLLGTGNAPHDPWMDVYDSRASIKTFGEELRQTLNREDLTASGTQYFWVTKDAEGGVSLAKVKGGPLEDLALREKLSLELNAQYAGEQVGVKKMTEQAEVFRRLETRFREQLADTQIRIHLSQIHAKMEQAQADFEKAVSAQQSAMKRAAKVSFLSEINKLAGTVSGLTGALNGLKAQQNYHQSAAQQASHTYNVNVNVLQQTFIQNNISQNYIISDPEIQYP